MAKSVKVLSSRQIFQLHKGPMLRKINAKMAPLKMTICQLFGQLGEACKQDCIGKLGVASYTHPIKACALSAYICCQVPAQMSITILCMLVITQHYADNARPQCLLSHELGLSNSQLLLAWSHTAACWATTKLFVQTKGDTSSANGRIVLPRLQWQTCLQLLTGHNLYSGL